jgi:hypothetical protein
MLQLQHIVRKHHVRQVWQRHFSREPETKLSEFSTFHIDISIFNSYKQNWHESASSTHFSAFKHLDPRIEPFLLNSFHRWQDISSTCDGNLLMSLVAASTLAGDELPLAPSIVAPLAGKNLRSQDFQIN